MAGCSYLLLGTALIWRFPPKKKAKTENPHCTCMALRSQEIFLHDVPTRASVPVKLVLLHKVFDVQELHWNKVVFTRSKECK